MQAEGGTGENLRSAGESMPGCQFNLANIYQPHTHTHTHTHACTHKCIYTDIPILYQIYTNVININAFV